MAQQKRDNTIKSWMARLLAQPLGRCLPAIGLCLLLCCMVTGYTVLRLEQREQYRQDTIVVYQSQPQPSAAPTSQSPQKSASVPTETPDTAVTGAEETTQAAQPGTGGLYASPSGKRYHYDAACPGKNSQPITWDEAQQRGLTPCKKCVPS